MVNSGKTNAAEAVPFFGLHRSSVSRLISQARAEDAAAVRNFVFPGQHFDSQTTSRLAASKSVFCLEAAGGRGTFELGNLSGMVNPSIELHRPLSYARDPFHVHRLR
jgi:hypothetical protein